ncbi:MAG: hypothetical protein ACOC16_01740 [Nanoarchaeota archaeon]
MNKNKESKRSKNNNNNKPLLKKLSDDYFWDNVTVGIFFLGVGSILFILNITTILHALQFVPYGLSLNGIYGSTVGSLIIMLYSLYNIYNNRDD